MIWKKAQSTRIEISEGFDSRRLGKGPMGQFKFNRQRSNGKEEFALRSNKLNIK